MRSTILQSISSALVEMDLEATKQELLRALEALIPPQDIVREGLSEGMEIVGNKFEDGEYFLAELITAGAIMEEAVKILEPHLKADSLTSSGKVVAGTVQGDLHDVGKNILVSMLRSSTFEVVDLGADVPPGKFILKAKEAKADIVCLSALLSVVVPRLEDTVAALHRDVPGVRVLIGGRCVDEKLAEKLGAAYAKDAWAGARMAVSLMKDT